MLAFAGAGSYFHHVVMFRRTGAKFLYRVARVEQRGPDGFDLTHCLKQLPAGHPVQIYGPYGGFTLLATVGAGADGLHRRRHRYLAVPRHAAVRAHRQRRAPDPGGFAFR